MKVVIMLLAIATVVPFFSGCKKGEKDPFLSLRSRDGRLMQKWALKTVEGTSVTSTTSTSTSGSTTTSSADKRTWTYKFDGSTYTESWVRSQTSGSTTTTTGDTSVYSSASHEIEFQEHGAIAFTEKGILNDKSGTSTSITTWKVDGTNTGVGNWMWTESNKHKDQLVVTIPNGSFFKSGDYYVYRLSHKELTLKRINSSTGSSTSTNTWTSGSTSSTSTGTDSDSPSNDITYTFEMKK